MTYPKLLNRLTLFLCLSLLSLNVQAELKPYTAVYKIYNKGFKIGEAKQTLQQREGTWFIKLVSKATGIASFFKSTPSTDEQVFSLMQQQPLLISAKSDSGNDEVDAKISAYYAHNERQLITRKGDKIKHIKINDTLSSVLLLPITAASLGNPQPIKITVYDQGKIKHKIMALQSSDESLKVVDVYTQGSNKRLRYIFKHNNMHVPFRIERIKNNDINAYLELDRFK